MGQRNPGNIKVFIPNGYVIQTKKYIKWLKIVMSVPVLNYSSIWVLTVGLSKENFTLDSFPIFDWLVCFLNTVLFKHCVCVH